MGKELRYYQENAIKAIQSARDKGVKKVLNVMATGTGKTMCTIRMIERMKFKRTLWLSDRETLVSQSGLAFVKDKFDTHFAKTVEDIGFLNWIKSHGGQFKGQNTSFKIGAIKAEIWQPEGDVIMGSLQTIHRRLDKLPEDYFDCIIADEAHGYCSPSAIKTLSYFKPELLCGLTGSPYRLDGLPLSDVFQEIVFEYDISQGIKDGFLCELEGIRIKTHVSLDKVHTLGGEFNQGELEQEVNIPERNKLIIESFIKYCGGRQAIGYAVNIQHAVDLAAIFNEYGISATAISSNEELTPDSQQRLIDYSKGKYQVIWNVGMIIAGYDHPDTGVVIQAAPTKSLTKFLQSTGRATRLKSPEYVSKYGQKAIILDIVDTTTRHSLINTWSLDKGKSTEERIFTTREQKDALLAQIAEKKAKFIGNRAEDERVNLLQLPKLVLPKSYPVDKEATSAQLASIARWGYDIENVHYTYGMITEIYESQPAGEKWVSFLKWKGYDVDGKFVSIAQAKLASKEIEKREAAAEREKRNQNIQKNLPFKF